MSCNMFCSCITCPMLCSVPALHVLSQVLFLHYMSCHMFCSCTGSCNTCLVSDTSHITWTERTEECSTAGTAGIGQIIHTAFLDCRTSARIDKQRVSGVSQDRIVNCAASSMTSVGGVFIRWNYFLYRWCKFQAGNKFQPISSNHHKSNHYTIQMTKS